jgi:hypothetical protein
MANCENIRGDNWSGDAWVPGSSTDDGPYVIPEDGVTQTYGQYGHEIVVTYLGPGDTASVWAFLDKVFGKWEISSATGSVCWELAEAPTPYWIEVDSRGFSQNDAPQHFFADSYQITPFCGVPEIQTAYYILPNRTQGCLNQEYRIPGPTGAPYVTAVADCVSIVITYRARDAGIFRQTYLSDYDVRGNLCICDPNDIGGGGSGDPEIPCIFPGTFVETRTTRDFAVVMTPGPAWVSVCNDSEGLDEDAGIPIHVLTIKHDIVWSNVPAVNELYLEKLSGSVNDLQFLGYPPEGVLFVYKDSVARTRWDGTVTYDVRMQFIAKTAGVYGIDAATGKPVECNYRQSAGPDDCVYCGRIGLWNRSWFPDLCHACSEKGDVIPYPPTCTDYYYCATNWHRVESRACAPPDFPPECVGLLAPRTPFIKRDLSQIFDAGLGCCLEI